MKTQQTVTRDTLQALCGEIVREGPMLLDGITDEGERNERLLRALYQRVCTRLNLDPDEQARGLGNSAGFQLMQTLEEYMDPEFTYTNVLDEHLLMKAVPVKPRDA